MRISFVRHGEAESNVDIEHGIVGSDRPLTKEGIEQVRKTADWMLGRIAVSQIISSPYIRTLQTSEIIAEKYGLDIITDDRLKEISKGDWAGRPVSEVMELEGAIDLSKRHSFRPPHGENWRDVGKRVISLIEELRVNGADNSLLVSHNHPILSVIGMARKTPTAEWENNGVSNASFTQLEYYGLHRPSELVPGRYNVTPYKNS